MVYLPRAIAAKFQFTWVIKMSTHALETEELKWEPKPAGRLIINFLQENKEGATVAEILRHLRVNHGKDADEMNRVVETLLENGTALGFLERKGSHYSNWYSREEKCGRRRRRRRRRSCRRRKIRRRSRRRRRRCRRS